MLTRHARRRVGLAFARVRSPRRLLHSLAALHVCQRHCRMYAMMVRVQVIALVCSMHILRVQRRAALAHEHARLQ